MDVPGGDLRKVDVGPGEGGQAGLPTGRVLSYLTNIATPTRVRIVAGRGALLVGLVEMALCLMGVVAVVLGIWKELGWWGFPGRGNWLDFADYFATELLGVGLLLLFGAKALTLVVLSWPIRHGRRGACYAGAVMLAPLTIFILLGAALCTGIAFVYGLDIGAVHPQRHLGLLWFLPALPIGVLLALLLMDLGGCMMWIARNPSVEMPPVAFVGAAEGG